MMSARSESLSAGLPARAGISTFVVLAGSLAGALRPFLQLWQRKATPSDLFSKPECQQPKDQSPDSELAQIIDPSK